MKRFFKITLLVLIDFVENIGKFIENNLRNFALILNAILPFLMYWIGQEVYKQRRVITFGSEILLPFLIGFIINYLKSYANKIGKGVTIPVPEKRFTEINDDEVSIDNDRIQELLLYTADLEDWLERKNLL